MSRKPLRPLEARGNTKKNTMADVPLKSTALEEQQEDLSPEMVPTIAAPIVSAAHNGGDFQHAIDRSIRSLGFEHFAFARFHRRGETYELDGKHWGTLPAEWDKHYRDRRLWRVDPRYRSALRSAIPEVWERSRYPDTPKLNDFFDAAAEFGIGSGVCMVVNQPNPSLVEYFSVCSPTTTLVPERRHEIASAMGDLWSIGVYGHRFLPADALAIAEHRRIGRTLSVRELECLTHAARGATSRQVAERLGISERTVDAHIERQEAIAINIGAGNITF